MQAKPSLLIIEDEAPILRGLTDLFVFHGFNVDSEMHGQVGLEKALNSLKPNGTRYSCIILDVMLPVVSGLNICHTIRQESPEQAIMMLTAKHTEADIINGLTMGADDYLTKPFSNSELVLRIKALVRRSNWQPQDFTIRVNRDVNVCTKTLVGKSYKQEIRYTRKEVKLLAYLGQQKKPVSRQELLQHVWGYKTTAHIDTRSVDIHIAKLRKKIEKSPKEPAHLITVRGEGYQLFCNE